MREVAVNARRWLQESCFHTIRRETYAHTIVHPDDILRRKVPRLVQGVLNVQEPLQILAGEELAYLYTSLGSDLIESVNEGS